MCRKLNMFPVFASRLHIFETSSLKWSTSFVEGPRVLQAEEPFVISRSCPRPFPLLSVWFLLHLFHFSVCFVSFLSSFFSSRILKAVCVVARGRWPRTVRPSVTSSPISLVHPLTLRPSPPVSACLPHHRNLWVCDPPHQSDMNHCCKVIFHHFIKPKHSFSYRIIQLSAASLFSDVEMSQWGKINMEISGVAGQVSDFLLYQLSDLHQVKLFSLCHFLCYLYSSLNYMHRLSKSKIYHKKIKYELWT